jgi:hypothetical protein
MRSLAVALAILAVAVQARAQPPVDFAQLEYDAPLTLEKRATLTPADLEPLDQENIDRIYARLTAGAIPEGPYVGRVLLKKGTRGDFEVDPHLLGFFGKLLVSKGPGSFDKLAEVLWNGKVFIGQDRMAFNAIRSLEFLKALRFVEGDPPAMTVGGAKAWLLFPAKVYCGQSMLDSRRESIVIDYLFTDDLPAYREKPDFLAGRRGLQQRDEIRMVRPGFYIGRAHVNRMFLLTFTLYNAEVDERERAVFMRDGPPREDCWTGTQARRKAVR